MKKETADSIFLVILFGSLLIVQGFLANSFNLTDILGNLIPVLVIVFINFNQNLSKFLTFSIVFLAFFFLFNLDTEAMVDWSSYLLTGILAGVMASMYLLLKIVIDNKRTVTDPLKGTILNWLRKKFPTISNGPLFLIDTLISTLIISFFSPY